MVTNRSLYARSKGGVNMFKYCTRCDWDESKEDEIPGEIIDILEECPKCNGHLHTALSIYNKAS